MVSNIIGSEILTSILNTISQSLLLPVIIILIVFAFYTMITLGGLITEYIKKKKIPMKDIKKLTYEISKSKNQKNVIKSIDNSILPEKHKEVLIEIASSRTLGEQAQIALARKLIEKEEANFNSIIKNTDIVTRIGPTVGLMGTLIPMGPGLAALGTGDITALSEAIIVAFDTTVVGVGSAAVAYCISKIRRGWYDEYISNLDALSDVILEQNLKE